MKILIFSDSHRDSTTMCIAVEKEQPDMIIYLGDGIADTEEVSRRHHDIKIIKVLGSLDSNKDDEEWVKYAEICGKRFMLAHGHTFYNNYVMNQDGTYVLTQTAMAEAQQSILKFMSENNIDITLHGHIHEPFLYNSLTQPKGWIMCPGRIGRAASDVGFATPMYGVLKIKKSGALEWQFVEVDEAEEMARP